MTSHFQSAFTGQYELLSDMFSQYKDFDIPHASIGHSKLNQESLECRTLQTKTQIQLGFGEVNTSIEIGYSDIS